MEQAVAGRENCHHERSEGSAFPLFQNSRFLASRSGALVMTILRGRRRAFHSFTPYNRILLP